MVIAAHLVVPDDINVSWKDIAGLDNVVQELKESVVLPVKHREMFQTSTLYQAPKGVLLHGPPGKDHEMKSLNGIYHISTLRLWKNFDCESDR